MRRSRGVLVLLGSVLVGLVVISASQPWPGHAPDIGKRWVAAAAPRSAGAPGPLIGKRWI
jgi:hypothetical protein